MQKPNIVETIHELGLPMDEEAVHPFNFEVRDVITKNFHILKNGPVVREAEVQKYMFTYHIEGQFNFMFILYLQV